MAKRENKSSALGGSNRDALSQLQARTDLTVAEEKKIDKLRRDLEREGVKSKYDLIRDLEEEAHQKRLANYEKEGNKIGAFWEKSFGSTDALLDTIDKSLNTYLKAQQSLAAHLSGSSTSLNDMMNKLQSTLSTTSIVKQQDVFNNLANLVKSGISYNVEQRAFLQTLAKDIDMTFDNWTSSMNQLVRLQNADTTANRLAIEYSLQQFLNENYKTSEYITSSFAEVSNALLSAQSTMTSSNAMTFEAAVQGQLGQMYSAGFNNSTVNAIAKAINDLGSGQIPSGGGISNLVLMAAARAGLDYGALLNEGLNAQSANTILSSLTQYMSEMGSNQSNVIKSQLGNLFGVTITDIMASQNLRNTGGSVTTDISGFLGDYAGFMSVGNRFNNVIDNLMYSFGTNMASNQSQLMTYEITKLIRNSGIGNLLQSYGDNLYKDGKEGRGVALQLAGIVANNAVLLPVLSSVLGSAGDILSSLKYTGNAVEMFNALGSSVQGSTVKISNAGTSGSMYIGNGSTSDILSGSTTSLNELTSSIETTEGDRVTLDDNVETISNNLILILDILDTYMENMNNSLSEIALTIGPLTNGWRNIVGASI